MPFTAGQKLRASQLAMIQPVKYFAQQTGNGGQQTITTTEADCLNCFVTFTSLTAAKCTVVAAFDIEVSATGAAIALGRCRVDSTTLGGEAHLVVSTAERATVAQVWQFTLSGAGSHTVKLRVLKTAAAGTVFVDDTHTQMDLTVNEVL